MAIRIGINWEIYSESSKKYKIKIFLNISNSKKKLDTIKTSCFHHIHDFIQGNNNEYY